MIAYKDERGEMFQELIVYNARFFEYDGKAFNNLDDIAIYNKFDDPIASTVKDPLLNREATLVLANICRVSFTFKYDV